jgi:hypothetical protein
MDSVATTMIVHCLRPEPILMGVTYQERLEFDNTRAGVVYGRRHVVSDRTHFSTIMHPGHRSATSP